MNVLYRENLAASGMFDFRGTAYDYDGYMLVGTVNLREDTTAQGSYLYMCARPGTGATGFSCASTMGTPADMSVAKFTATKISSFTKTDDFNTYASVGGAPVQHVVDGNAGTIMTAKTCGRQDGTNGCWGSSYTGAANKGVYKVWMYQLRQKEYMKPVMTSYGFRYNAGDTLDAGLIVSKAATGADQQHFGYTFTLSGATSTILGYSAIVAGVLTTMF